MKMNSSSNSFDKPKNAYVDTSLPLAVVVARTRWDEPPRIRHHITYQLMRWFNVLFVEFFPAIELDKNREKWRKISEKLVVFSPCDPLSIPIRLYANVPFTHKFVNHYYKKIIRGEIVRQNKTNSVLFNFVYDFPEIMNVRCFDYKAYVCYDEFPRMQRSKKKRYPLKFLYQSTLFQHYENQVARKADRCITPHYPMREKLLKVNGQVEMLFHAHDYEFSKGRYKLEKSKQINIGYAGYLNWRLLSNWLLEVADQEDMTLHLIGPVEKTFNIEDFEKHRSIIYIPPLSEDELFQKLTKMDVLIMPYNPDIPEVRILTTNSKTFQYIAAGKPMVISNLPNYIDMPKGVIYKAKNKENFVNQIRKAYQEDCQEFVNIRREITQENSWGQRGDQLIKLLKRELPNLLGSGNVNV